MAYKKARHKTGKGIIATFITIILALVLVIVAAIGSQGFTIKDFKKWFKSWGKGDVAVSTPITDIGGVEIDKPMNGGVKLTTRRLERSEFKTFGVAAQADSAYSLTATVEPENARDKSVDFTLTWANPASTWANGKSVSDYATVTPSSDGGTTATLTCLQAFGEEIVATVTSRDNKAAKATAAVHYVAHVESISLNLPDVKFHETQYSQLSFLTMCNVTYGVGTKRGTLSVDSGNFKWNITPDQEESLRTIINNEFTTDLDFYSHVSIHQSTLSLTGEPWEYLIDTDTIENDGGTFNHDCTPLINNFIADQNLSLDFSITYKYAYNGNTVGGAVTVTQSVAADVTSFISASSIDLDKSEIIFY